MDCYASENSILKKKVGSLEVANRSLIMQVQKLQALVTAKISPPSPSTDKQQEIIGEWSPFVFRPFKQFNSGWIAQKLVL